MPVSKRENTPYFQYNFTVKGRRFRGSTQATTRQAALLVEHELREEILQGKYKEDMVTFAAAVALYWNQHGYKLSSAKTLKYQIANLSARFGATDIHEIQGRHIAEYRQVRSAQVSEPSVNREITIMRAIINKAVNELGYQGPKILWKNHFYIEPDARDTYLTTDQADKLITAADDDLAELITFTLYTGVRKANCLNLEWGQIDLGAMQITFRTKSRKPGGKVHVVPITRQCMIFLANLERRGDKVFNTVNFRRKWKAAKKAAKLDLRWHDLRHTCASWLVQEGVALDTVMKILGHSEIRTTMRYAHRADNEKRLGLEAIASHIRHIEKPKVDKSLNLKQKTG